MHQRSHNTRSPQVPGTRTHEDGAQPNSRQYPQISAMTIMPVAANARSPNRGKHPRLMPMPLRSCLRYQRPGLRRGPALPPPTQPPRLVYRRIQACCNGVGCFWRGDRHRKRCSERYTRFRHWGNWYTGRAGKRRIEAHDLRSAPRTHVKLAHPTAQPGTEVNSTPLVTVEVGQSRVNVS